MTLLTNSTYNKTRAKHLSPSLSAAFESINTDGAGWMDD